MKMKITKEPQRIIIEDYGSFDLGLSLDCGQAFRWAKNEAGRWCGIADGKYLEAEQHENRLILYTSPDDFDCFWRSYFDLDFDYSELCTALSADQSLRSAIQCCPGIHILRQEPWETLCSFIISQNNNIPRIKGIITRLCENFGTKTVDGYTFPTAVSLASLSPEDLAPLRSGFRAKYIIDAAQKVADGEVDFEKIRTQPIDFGRIELQKIKGVGAKVAECTLLYGFYKVDAFPVDVWVKRIMAEMYPDGLPECAQGHKGIAQQYLFHWRRNYF